MDWNGTVPAWVKPVVLVTVLVVLWLWESARPFFEKPHGRWRHAARSLCLALLNTVLLALTFGVATVGVVAWTESHRTGLLHVWSLPGGVRLVLAVLLLDGWLYLWHRANHVIPLLWRFHRMHHADREMDVTTALRFHTGELVLSAIVRLTLIPLLGVTSAELLVHETLVVAATAFHHANISVGSLDRWLALGIVTPFLHKVHHSREPVETNSNYATVFSWWDRLGGTLRQCEDCQSLRLGLDEFDDPRWETLAGLLSIPAAQRPASVLEFQREQPVGDLAKLDSPQKKPLAAEKIDG